MQQNLLASIPIMVSAIDRANRLLVSLLKSLATTYCVVLQLSRDAADAELTSSFRKVSRKAHPDQGGKVADQTALNNARDAWQDAVKEVAGKHGAGKKKGTAQAKNKVLI